MKGHGTAAVDLSLGSDALLNCIRSKGSPASVPNRSRKSNTYGVSRLFQAKVEARETEDLKKLKWNRAGTHESELFAKRQSSFLEQRKVNILIAGRGGSGSQLFASWRGQDASDGMATRNSKPVVGMNVGDTRNREESFQPPRLCTLREFREGGGVTLKADTDDGSAFLKTLAANAEALVQVKNFELLSGRFAMIAFAFALGMEYITGNSVFKGIDFQKLGEVAILCAVAATSAGIFAIGWGAKAQISVFMSRGYQNLVDSTLDTIVDGLFYEDS